MSIKNLRASGSTLLADVVIGANEYGSDVTVQLRLQCKDPEVAKALEPLEKLLKDTANEYLTTSRDTAFIQTQVRERTKIAVEEAKARLLKNATTVLEQKVQTLERYLSSAQSEADRWKKRYQEADDAAREAANAQAQV